MTFPHLLLVLLVDAVWGFNYVAAKVGVDVIPPIWFTGIRFLIVAVLLAPALRWRRGQMRTMLGVSVFSGVLHFALTFTGLKLAGDVSTVAIASQLGTPIATIMAMVLLHERVRWKRGLGIILTIGGVAFLSFDPRVFAYIDAVILITLASCSMAYGQILMRRLRNIGVFTAQAWIALISSPGLFLVSLIFETGQFESMAAASTTVWAAAAYTAIGASVIGHGGMYFLLQRYPITLVAPMLTLSPVMGVFAGIMIMGDVLTPKMIVGGLIALAGAILTSLPEGSRRQDSA